MKALFFSLIIFTIFIAVPVTEVCAQDYDPFGTTELGLAIGHWQPQNLRAQDIVSLFSATSNTSPYFGFFVAAHWKNSLTFKSSIGYWAHERIERFTKVCSVVMVPLEFQLKYQLIQETRLSPFVSYGVAGFIGTESRISTIKAIVLRNAQIGYGFEAGAGFDFFITPRWGIAVEFQYLYVRFGQPVGTTDDYSGQRISVSFYRLFGKKSSVP